MARLRRLSMIRTRQDRCPERLSCSAHLAARFAAVALLSGRPADYLVKHAAAPGVRYLGLYIAVLRAEDGVNPDPGRIVVGQTSEKTGTYNGTSQMSVVSR